jgi:dihydroorotate dehydrogenase (fumarate)
MGLTLAHPIVASAGPLTQSVDGVTALARGGAAAIVLHSLFEEQIRQERATALELEVEFDDINAEGLSYFPSVPTRLPNDEDVTTRSYLSLLSKAVEAVDVPVIASLNGATMGGWTTFAKKMEDAGAAGLELNIYYVPGDGVPTGVEVEDRHCAIVEAVKQSITIPVAVKLSPYFSSFGQVARRLGDAGADALVLFNRFYQPDIDLETMEAAPGIEFSTPFDARLPRTWISTLRRTTKESLAGSSGVHSAADVVKYILAGADVVMTTSALVENGPGFAAVLRDGLDAWLSRAGFASLAEARGKLALSDDIDATDYQRQGYVAALQRAKQMYGSFTAN